MKNFNRVNRAIMAKTNFCKSLFLILAILTIGMGKIGAATSSTFYFAINAATIGGDCNNVKFCVKYGGGDSEWSGDQTMTKQNASYNGKLVYKATYSFSWGGYYNWQFMNGTGLYREIYAGGWNTTLHNGQIYDYDNNAWYTYSADASYSIYFVNNNDWANPKVYAYNSSCDYNTAWNGAAISSSTGKTLNGKTIYKIDFSKRYANVIFSNNGANQTADLILGTTNAGKMWDGDSWETYQFDITLDQQNGSGGTSSVIGVVGSAMPSSKTAPTRTGYTFGGYYTSTGGSGTCYYNASMVSQTNVSASTPNTLYAKWTKKTYTVTVNNDGHGTTSPSGAQSSIAQVDGIAISADADDNYEFVNWTIESGTGSFTDATDASTTFYPTSAATIQANFRSTLTYSLTVAAGSNVGTVTGSTDPVTLGNSYAISASNFTSGYEFNNWTASPAANASFASSTSASTNVTVSNGSVTVTANAREIMRNITISGGTVYGGAATSTTAGVATSAKITANAPAAGKKFTGWSLGSGVSLKGGYNLTDRTIEIYSTANATVTAQYADRAQVKLYFAKPTSLSWGTLYAYAWDKDNTSDRNAAYPGETVSTTEAIGCVTYYVYQYYTEGDGIGGSATGKTTWNRVIFGCNSDDKKTADLAISNGHFYYKADAAASTGRAAALASAWLVKGDYNSWDESDALTPNCGANSATKTISLTTGNKTFKIYNIVEDKWWRITADNITATLSATAMNNNTGNMTLKPTVAGNYTFTLGSTNSTPTLAITFPTAYTVTFGKGTGGNTITASATSAGGAITSGAYVADGDDVTFTQTALSGYTFSGWYTTKDAGGSVVTGMGVGDNVLENVTSNKTVWSRYTPNNYTVTFDKNGGTTTPSPSSKSVTFGSAYGELPGGMTHASKTFAGWYTDPDDGEGDLIMAESIVSIAENHTLYAHYEGVYRVDVNFKCGGANLYPATSVNASPTVLSPTITAPEILGYNFTGWEETGGGSYVTFADDEAATTTITTTGAATIVANYSAIPTVYFKNNLGWEKVYVTFDCNWVTAGGKSVPSNNTKPYFEMTQLGTSDIYSCVIPDAYVTGEYAGWKNNIAFDNHGFAASDNVGTNTAFNAGEFLGRGDFDPSATMYIPYDGDSETRNSGTYYRTGCWMKYNSTDPGYKVYVNTWKSGDGGEAVGDPVLLTADVAGGFEFKAKVSLGTANYTYGFMLHKEYSKNSNAIWYTNTDDIYSSTTTLPWHFYTDGASENGTRCGLHTESTGDYEFTVSFGTGRPVVDVTYPVSVGDWRLAYNDRIAWSGDAHGEDWYLYSRVVKAKADAEDLVSFYVSKAVGANAHVELQKCTAINPSTGAETWVKQGDDLDFSEITGTGIYNFKITQDGSKVATAAYDGAYEGNFYIRTDASDGGWTNYKTSGTNTMTYSEYAEDNSGFTHYYMRFVTTGSNIKFCIANDYSPCLTEYCVNDTYTNEWIEANGNVRFMWDHRTNIVSRAYISGSSIVSDRFLVLEGDAKMFDEDGNALTTAGGGKISGLNDYEMKFIDDQNWIYEATVKAQPTARIKLTAKYNNKIQYFYGAEGARTDETTVQLIGGKGSEKYKVRVVYDFKTNRLITAFIPDADIDTELEIDADLMIIREHQGEAQQVTFTGSGKLADVKTVYGAMKFNKYTVNGKEKTGGHASTGASRYERDLFYISFPFDVKLSDAFGFGTYGKHWIIEYYDGKGRAANGFWADSPSNWKFVMPSQRSSFTMRAFEGYILALDLDEMTESSSIWNNGVEDVYVYFPSSAEVEDIEATNRLIEIDQEGYECTINRPTADGDRRVKDSYWHCIGVPSFANYSSALKPTSGGSPIDWSDDNSDGDEDQWTTPNLPYLYEWVRSNNTLSVTSSATFNFKATWSYLVQYAGASIYWSQVNATPAGIVARRTYEEAPTSTEFCIELQQEGNKADQTFVRLTNDENVTSGFDFNYDLSKEFNRNKANIYTIVTSDIDGDLSTTETAGNCLPMTEQTTIVPMGVQIAKAGEYTISIPSGTNGVGVTLIDNETGLRTNLALEDYRVELDAATYNSRFIIEISPIVSVLTNVEQTAVSDQPSDVRKVIIDQKMYIIKDGKVYDAQGARVR